MSNPGPKSTASFMEGLRAFGNGPASTTLPTRTSTFSKSSQLISGIPDAPRSCNGSLALDSPNIEDPDLLFLGGHGETTCLLAM